MEGEEGYLKIHFAVDIRTKQVVSMDVSSEKVGDGERLMRLVKRGEERQGGQGARRRGLRLEGELQLPRRRAHQAVIRIRKGSVPKSRGSQARKLAVIEQQAFKPRSWSRIHRFGYRWRVEGVFSCIKRTFGGYVTAMKFANMAKEMAMKASIYNRFMAMV